MENHLAQWIQDAILIISVLITLIGGGFLFLYKIMKSHMDTSDAREERRFERVYDRIGGCLLYTSPSPRDS